jgi:tetratricopeptide (TPR) repeat protein
MESVEKTEVEPIRPIWPVIVFIATAAFFFPTLGFEVTSWDDVTYIDLNPYIRVLSLHNLREVFAHSYFSNYHPLTMITYALDYSIAGRSPEIIRLQNILWHCGSVILLGCILHRWCRLGVAAWLLAFAWGIHPMRYESVVWLSERKDVLSVFFFLLALVLHIRGSRMETGDYHKRVLPWEILAVLLALLSKSMAVTYVAIAVLFDLLFQRERMRGRVASYLVFASLTVLFSFANMGAQERALSRTENATIPNRIRGVSYSPWYYVSRSVVPVELAPIHPRIDAPKPTSPRVIFAGIFTLGCAIVAFGIRKSHPKVAFGIGFYLITLSPVSGLIPVGHAYVAERYSYLPTVGFVIAIGTLAAGTRMAMRLVPAFAILIPMMFFKPLDQLFAWRTSGTLWARALEVHPRFERARLNVMKERIRAGGVEPSAEEYLKVNDEFRDGSPEREAIRILMQDGNVESAKRVAQETADLLVREMSLAYIALREDNPEAAAKHALAVVRDPKARSREFAKCANILLRAGKIAEAEEVIRNDKMPESMIAIPMGQLAMNLIRSGQPERALEWIQRAEQIDPTQYDVARARATYDVANEKPEEAIKRMERVLRRRDCPPRTKAFLLGMVAFLFDSQNMHEQALATYEEALRADTRDLITLQNHLGLARGMQRMELVPRIESRIAAIQAAERESAKGDELDSRELD